MTKILAPQIFVVPEVTVQVATGETCYPGENGFSAHWAEVLLTEPADVQALAALSGTGSRVVLRCAQLDVRGQVTKFESTKRGTRFVLSIEDLTYRKS